jgi:hypothetical protein
VVVKRRIVGLALVVGVVQYDHDVEYSKPKEGRKVQVMKLYKKVRDIGSIPVQSRAPSDQPSCVSRS